MSVELKSGRDIVPQRHVLLVPGMTVSHADIEGTIGPVLGQTYGEANVHWVNSAVTPDPVNPRWRKDIARTILEHGPTGLDVVQCSGGTTQVWMANREVRAEQKGFYDRPDVQQNTHFINVGPSGFANGVKEKRAYPNRVRKAIFTSFGTGLDALAAFPPDESQVDQNHLAEILEIHGPHSESFKLAPRTDLNRNTEFLTDDERRIQDLSYGALQHAVTTGNQEQAVSLVTQIGRNFRRPLMWAFRGAQAAERSRTGDPYPEPHMNYGEGVWDGVRLLARSNGSQPMKEQLRFHKAGIDVSFLAPANDIGFPLPRVEAFFGGDLEQATEHTIVGRVGGHSSLHLQPEHFVNAMQVLTQRARTRRNISG